jgi:hypothetical protein
MSRIGNAIANLLGVTPAGPTYINHIEEAGPNYIDKDDAYYRAYGATLRDLTGNTLRRAQDISVDLYRKNPLANRIVKIYTTFMAGEGFAINAANPDVQAITDEFWYAERNEMDLNHRRFARDWLLYGEAHHPVAVDETGNTTIGFIDPQRVERITTSDLNQLILESVVLLRGGTGEQQALQIVHRQTDPALDDLGLLTGETFAWLFDRIGASTRGTPFLLPIVDWLDAYDQTLWELLERVKAARAFFWDVTVEGGEQEVEDAKAVWGTTAPKSGTARFHTNAMTVEAQQPTLGAYEDVAAARYILRLISTGAGLAPHWLGDPEDANRSTAEQMDIPVLRALQDTQAQWKAQMEEALRFVVDRKVAAGLLPAVVPRYDEQGNETGEELPARELIEVITPALTDDEIEAAAASIAAVAGAFTQLDMIDVVDRESMRKVIRALLPALGVPADELPDPEEEGNDEEAEELVAALESLRRRAERSGKLEELQERL